MKTAYVTMLSNGDTYAPGVEVLGRSLTNAGSRCARVAMVTADVGAGTRATLVSQGWAIHDVEPIANPSPEHELFPRFDGVFTKLRVWELIDFERVVFLDGDTLVLQNVDDLFERQGFAAAPDFFLPDRFNSGVMVLEPSRATFARMVAALAAAGSYDGGDQGFLNTFFPDWYAMTAEHRLPAGYNLAHFIYQFLHGHPTLKESLQREAKIIHYMVQKPWLVRSTLTGGSDVWWRTYFDVHPDEARGWKARLHTMEDWTFDRLSGYVLA